MGKVLVSGHDIPRELLLCFYLEQKFLFISVNNGVDSYIRIVHKISLPKKADLPVMLSFSLIAICKRTHAPTRCEIHKSAVHFPHLVQRTGIVHLY